MRQQKPILNKGIQGPSSADQYTTAVDELARRNKGRATLYAQDAGSNTPYVMTEGAPVRMPGVEQGQGKRITPQQIYREELPYLDPSSQPMQEYMGEQWQQGERTYDSATQSIPDLIQFLKDSYINDQQAQQDQQIGQSEQIIGNTSQQYPRNQQPEDSQGQVLGATKNNAYIGELMTPKPSNPYYTPAPISSSAMRFNPAANVSGSPYLAKPYMAKRTQPTATPTPMLTQPQEQMDNEPYVPFEGYGNSYDMVMNSPRLSSLSEDKQRDILGAAAVNDAYISPQQGRSMQRELAQMQANPYRELTDNQIFDKVQRELADMGANNQNVTNSIRESLDRANKELTGVAKPGEFQVVGNLGKAPVEKNPFESAGNAFRNAATGLGTGVMNTLLSPINAIASPVQGSEKGQNQQKQGKNTTLDQLQGMASTASNVVGQAVSNATKKAGEGIKMAQNTAQNLVDAGSNIFKKMDPSKYSAKNKIGETGQSGNSEVGGMSSMLDSNKTGVKQDNRDAFFKGGGFETYKDYLNPNITKNYRGALDPSLFKDSFYEDADRVANVFGSTSMAGNATGKYKNFMSQKYPIKPGGESPTVKKVAEGKYDDGSSWRVEYDDVNPIYYENKYNQSVLDSIPATLKSDFRFKAPVAPATPAGRSKALFTSVAENALLPSSVGYDAKTGMLKNKNKGPVTTGKSNFKTPTGKASIPVSGGFIIPAKPQIPVSQAPSAPPKPTPGSGGGSSGGGGNNGGSGGGSNGGGSSPKPPPYTPAPPPYTPAPPPMSPQNPPMTPKPTNPWYTPKSMNAFYGLNSFRRR